MRAAVDSAWGAWIAAWHYTARPVLLPKKRSPRVEKGNVSPIRARQTDAPSAKVMGFGPAYRAALIAYFHPTLGGEVIQCAGPGFDYPDPDAYCQSACSYGSNNGCNTPAYDPAEGTLSTYCACESTPIIDECTEERFMYCEDEGYDGCESPSAECI